MKKLFIGLLTICLVTAFNISIASANHFRSGTLSWSPVPGEDKTVLVKSQVVWTNDHGHIPTSTAVGGVVNNKFTLYWGDGTSTPVSMRVISRDSGSNDVFTEAVSDLDNDGTYETTGLKHTYATDGDYTVYWNGGARESASSQSGSSWQNETIINIGTGNTGPVSAVPSIIQVQDNTEFSYQLSAADSDGDTLRFRLGTQEEFYNNSNNSPVTPPTGLTLSSTGLIEWDVRDETLSTSIGARWQMTLMVEDLDNEGSVKSKTPLDFVLLISDGSNTPPNFTSTPSGTQEVSVGQTLNFSLEGTDPDWAAGDSPTITILNPPSTDSEIWSTTLSESNADTEIDVTFTPDESMSGNSYIINFRISDQGGATGVATVTIQVPAGPVNEDPTDITLNNQQSIDDRTENETLIGDLSGTDPDDGDTLSFSLTDDAGGAFKIINDNEIVVANSSALVSPNQTIAVRVTDQNDAFYEENFVITVDYVAPVIEDLAVKTPDTENPDDVQISWNKQDAETAHFDYGLRETYGHTEEDTDETVDLSLLGCANYEYRIRLIKSGNTIAGNNQDMTTGGCVGDAQVITQNKGDITKTTGGEVSLMSNNSGTKLSVPKDFKTGETQAQFQVKKLQSDKVISATGTPNKLFPASGHIYDFKALTNITEQITEFDAPISVTIQYTDSDISGFQENTFQIFRWHDEQWEALENCIPNYAENYITCETSKFSVFGLFGIPSPQAVAQIQNRIQNKTSSKNSGSGKGKTIRWRGMARGEILSFGGQVTKHNFEEYYQKSKDQIAKMNSGIPSESKYMVNRWGEHVFAGFIAGKLALERFPHRFQNIVRFGSGSLTKGRGIVRNTPEEITEEEFFASASDTSELIVEEPTNEGWKDEYQLAKDKFTKSVEKKDLFASAPIEVKKTTIQEDQIVTHLNQRKYYDRKGIVDHKRDISMVRPSRMDATKDMDTVKIRIGGKSVSMSRYLQNNLFGNQDGQNDTSSTSLLLVLLGFIGIIGGIMFWNLKKR